MVDVTRIRYFVVVAETGSVRKAADLLHISPAALSKAVKVLEQELGTRLVERVGRGIELTDTGRRLVIKARPLLDQVASLADELNSRRPTGPQPVRIGSHEVFGTYVATEFVANLPHDTPFSHRYFVPGEIEQALLDEVIDIGISYIPVPTAGTETTEVARSPMGIWGLPKMRRRAFDNLPFAAPIGPVIGSALRAQGLDGWPDDRIPRKVPYRVTHTESALQLCRAGLAVAYFPEFAVRLHNKVTDKAFRLVQLPSPKGLGKHKQPIHVITRSGESKRFGVTEITTTLKSLIR